MINEKIQKAAADAGYELAHAQESHGEHFFGLLILVKMSNRKIDKGDNFARAAELIKKGVDTVSAQLDPEGAATRERYRADVAAIYKMAGVEPIYMEELPNGYCSDPCCLNKPWFRVTSRIGHVTIGWRKSVMSIDWEDSTVKASGEALFPFEDVTRWDTGIHAWGPAKAALYIRELHKRPCDHHWHCDPATAAHICSGDLEGSVHRFDRAEPCPACSATVRE